MAYNKGVNGMFYLLLPKLLCFSLTPFIRFWFKSKCFLFKCLCINVKINVEIKKQENLQLGTKKYITN